MRAAGSPHPLSIGGSFKARMEKDRKITLMVAIMVNIINATLLNLKFHY